MGRPSRMAPRGVRMREGWSRYRVSIAVLVVGLALSVLAWRSTSLYVERQEALALRAVRGGGLPRHRPAARRLRRAPAGRAWPLRRLRRRVPRAVRDVRRRAGPSGPLPRHPVRAVHPPGSRPGAARSATSSNTWSPCAATNSRWAWTRAATSGAARPWSGRAIPASRPVPARSPSWKRPARTASSCARRSTAAAIPSTPSGSAARRWWDSRAPCSGWTTSCRSPFPSRRASAFASRSATAAGRSTSRLPRQTGGAAASPGSTRARSAGKTGR